MEVFEVRSAKSFEEDSSVAASFHRHNSGINITAEMFRNDFERVFFNPVRNIQIPNELSKISIFAHSTPLIIHQTMVQLIV
jgi:hypothetical protein